MKSYKLWMEYPYPSPPGKMEVVGVEVRAPKVRGLSFEARVPLFSWGDPPTEIVALLDGEETEGLAEDIVEEVTAPEQYSRLLSPCNVPVRYVRSGIQGW